MIPRKRSFVLIAIYAAYLGFLLWRPLHELSVSARIVAMVGAPLLTFAAIAAVLFRFLPKKGRSES
ncbi:hypothetical protein EON82_05840 [bacterium]|nr:MAG: hypothetical protein EON82_05840 [bacterium]